MRFLSIDGVVLHARIEGDTGLPPVVLLHGLGTDLRVFNRLVRYLVDRLWLVRYDQRGHGLSGVASPPYRIDDLAADAAGLMDQLDTGPAVVCGVSLGGMVAIRLAVQRPDLVRGLVIMAATPRMGTARLWQERSDVVAAGGLAAIADGVLERWFPRSFHEAHPEEIEGWRAMLTRAPVEGYLGAAAAIRDADLTGDAGAIAVPTLCLVGEQDGVTPPEVVHRLAAAIPRGRIEVVPGAGHLPCVDQPAAVAAAMLGFLESEGLA